MSGWALGEKQYLGNNVAMKNVRYGDGNVVLYGFCPQFRGQPRGTYKLIFNPLFISTMDQPIIKMDSPLEISKRKD